MIAALKTNVYRSNIELIIYLRVPQAYTAECVSPCLKSHIGNHTVSFISVLFQSYFDLVAVYC